MAVVGLYTGGLVAQDADVDPDRLARAARSIKSRIRQVEEYIEECNQETTYEPLVAACDKWRPALLDMKAYWEKRLALLEEKNIENSDELYKEERTLRDKSNDGQRVYHYARTAFSLSTDKMQEHYRNMVERTPSLKVPLEELAEARLTAEKFYVEMTEKGTSLTMEETVREADVLLGVEKAKCVVDFETSKVHIDHELRRLEQMPENVQTARQALLDNYTDMMNLKIERAENWANERVTQKRKHELERALHDAMQKARREEERRRAMQEQAKRKAMQEEARRKAMQEDAKRKAETGTPGAPASDY
jgi:hypothetical protein